MPALLDHIDPNGLEEFSVVFTDRSLNHMSKEFQQVMCDLSSNLKEVYNSSAVVLVPGGGTFAMEAVARQFGIDANVLVIETDGFLIDGARYSSLQQTLEQQRWSKPGWLEMRRWPHLGLPT